MKSLTLAALVLLSFPSFVSSQMDVGVVAASLPDEASECRFLLNLCQRREELRKDADQQRELAAGDYLSEHMSAYLAASELSSKYLTDALTAARVIRAKHDKMPSCFQECGFLNLERFQ